MSENNVNAKAKASDNKTKEPLTPGIATETVNPEASILDREIKVSVIMPVYNACRYIRPAIESILSQTLREIELICIDDGSTDTSLDMLKIYQKADNRIRILTETNAGPGLARNNGIKRARGEYLAFLDADDFYEPTLLEELYNVSKEKNLDIAICKYDIFENKKARFRENIPNEHNRIYNDGVVTSKNEHPDRILESTTGSAWNKLFRKSFVIEKGITFLSDAMMFEDVYFTVSALAFAERISKVEKVLVHHRVYNQQSRVRTFSKYYPHVPSAFEKTKEFLMKGGMYQPLKKSFLNLSCSRCYHIYNLLKSDAKEVFWNMLHDYYSEVLGWEDTLAEDFNKTEICEWAAYVEMYTYEQYVKRVKQGRQINTDKIDQKLKQNKRWRKFRAFLAKLFKKGGKK